MAERIGTFVVGGLLMLEGLSSGVRLARFAPILVIYPRFTAALLVARAAIGVLQFASGWTLLQRRPFGPTLGRVALVVSAVFVTFEIGLALVPTSLFPSYRWPAVGLYWMYTLAATAYLTWRARA